MDIVATYKQSTKKLEVIEKICREADMEPKDVFIKLIEANAVDGRLFRQGRYKDDWFEAKKAIKKDNIQRAADTSKSLTEEVKKLREENARLQEYLKEAEVPESYQITIDMQQKQIEHLKADIEQMKDEYKASDDMNEKLQNEKSDTDALIEDLNSVVKLREDEIKELNERIDELFKSATLRADEVADLREELDNATKTIGTRDEKIEELENRIKHLKVSDFNSAADSMINESKLKTAEDEIARLKEYIRGLEEQLEDETPSNGETLKRQLDETTQNYNEAMLMNKKLEEQIKYYEDEKDGDSLIIVDQAKKNCTLEKKLRKAEEYILNQLIYNGEV